jgi:hypothetical protein
MNEAGWEIIQARAAEFAKNVGELWLHANNDQRIFIVTLVIFSLSFFLLAMLVLRWRIVNRREIRRMRHLALLRSNLREGQDD